MGAIRALKKKDLCTKLVYINVYERLGTRVTEMLVHIKNFSILGNTEAKKTDIVDTFLDLGRNLLPDNLFQAAFQSVSKFSVFSQHVLIAH